MPARTREERTLVLFGLMVLYIGLLLGFAILEIGGLPIWLSTEIYEVLFLFTGIAWENAEAHNLLLYAGGCAFRLLLTIAPVLGIGWLVIIALFERNIPMKLADAVRLRDSRIKTTLRHNLKGFLDPNRKEEIEQEFVDTLNDAFTSANERLHSDLESQFGPKVADAVRAHLQASVPG